MGKRTTIEMSCKTLNRARTELHHAHDDEGVRQACEKGWRAAKEAVYAVLFALGAVDEEHSGTVGSKTVLDLENTHFSDCGTSISRGYAQAKGILHGEGFYDGAFSFFEKDKVEEAFAEVDLLIEDCTKALRHLEVQPGFNKRRR